MISQSYAPAIVDIMKWFLLAGLFDDIYHSLS